MAYRVNASTARRNPQKYYERVICHCFGAKGQPQILVYSKAELKAERKKEKETHE